MLPTSDSVARLLAVEDDRPDVLRASVDESGLALWPRVRMAFAEALTASELGSVAVASSTNIWALRRRLIHAKLPSRRDAASLRGRRRHLFLMGGTTIHIDAGKQRNWLSDELFAQVADDAHLLQWAPFTASPALRGARSLDPMMARVGFDSRRRPLPDARRRRIDELVEEYAALFDYAISPARIATIRDSTHRFEHLRPLIHDEFERILDRIHPEIVLMEDASYGSRGSLIAAMKARGIRVVEPQHGWIGPSHPAYNFGRAMREAGMSEQLPDELLTFGPFWSEGLRHPAKQTPIGKPTLERAAANAPAFENRPYSILVASSVADPSGTAAFVLALRDALPEWTVVFRPHPSERATLSERYPSLTEAVRVEIDLRGDVYDSLAAVRAATGTASTVLFEAARFGVHVFVRRSPFTSYYVGDIFGPPLDDEHAPTMIAERVRHSPQPTRTIDAESLWTPDPIGAFRRWASELGAP